MANAKRKLNANYKTIKFVIKKLTYITQRKSNIQRFRRDPRISKFFTKGNYRILKMYVSSMVNGNKQAAGSLLRSRK